MDWRPACSLDALRARAALLREVREFFHRRGVLEVQTSVLAAATVTEPAVESLTVPGLGYLQTSPEYQMKRLLAAGAPSHYQLGPVFRAGEAGRRHNPEFVMLEWYRLGFTDAELMAEVAALVDLALGPAPTRTLTYREVLERAAADPVETRLTPREALDLRISAGLDALGAGRFFVTDYPADQAALARLRPGDESVAARFELVVDGLELANGYWELGDPDALRSRFAADLEQRRCQGQRQPEPDERFLAAMNSGLPPCAGVALGFDRLLMLKLGVASLEEVMAFPIDRA
ncbi:MAG: amino acid--tRNA ligase-related protein [Pseudomonadales bacterium]